MVYIDSANLISDQVEDPCPIAQFDLPALPPTAVDLPRGKVTAQADAVDVATLPRVCGQGIIDSTKFPDKPFPLRLGSQPFPGSCCRDPRTLKLPRPASSFFVFPAGTPNLATPRESHGEPGSSTTARKLGSSGNMRACNSAGSAYTRAVARHPVMISSPT